MQFWKVSPEHQIFALLAATLIKEIILKPLEFRYSELDFFL